MQLSLHNHHPVLLATVAQTRRLEALAVEHGATWAELMERAGRGVADAAMRCLPDIRDARVLVLVGPGNNGGDGLVVARLLHDAGAKVALYIWQRVEQPDDQPWRGCRSRAIPELHARTDETHHALRQAAQRADLIIDGLLGIGVTRPVDEVLARIVRTINDVHAARVTARPLVLAIDVPTGLNADTGAIMGVAVQADLTVATGTTKPGHLLYPGREYAGKVVCASIGLPDMNEEIIMADTLNTQTLRALLPTRPVDSHKGTFGKAMIVAGSGRYPGAAFLAASGAMRAGTGLVTLACGRSIFGALAAGLHEATFLPLPEEDWGVLGADAAKELLKNLSGYSALVLGPGLGREDETKKFVERLLKLEAPKTATSVGFVPSAVAAAAERVRKPGGSVGFRLSAPTPTTTTEADARPDESEIALPPVVVDADGLNLLNEIEEWWTKVPANRMVLTPHPGEMTRLLKLNDATEVNADRLGTALRAAQEWQQIVVLKGAETVIAAPDGKASIGPAGNPALATAGTGDVLAGVIGGLIAQGVEPFDAARLGVWLHAQAGQLVRHEIGEAGVVAGDLLLRLPLAIRELRGA